MSEEVSYHLLSRKKEEVLEKEQLEEVYQRGMDADVSRLSGEQHSA